MIGARRGAGAASILGALHLRRLPDRHRHQDAGRRRQADPDIAKNPVVRFLRRHMRVTRRAARPEILRARARREDRQAGRAAATPLFLALVVINIADLVFAVDIVPAIFAITTDTFIVYTANIMAILGLRALYFALAAMVHRFHYLKYALAPGAGLHRRARSSGTSSSASSTRPSPSPSPLPSSRRHRVLAVEDQRGCARRCRSRRSRSNSPVNE